LNSALSLSGFNDAFKCLSVTVTATAMLVFVWLQTATC